MGGRLHQPKARDEIGRSVRFYAALGLVTAATLMLQIIETRIISVTSWYHLAFFVISIAMFGLTAGAVFVYLRKDMFKRERLSYDLAVATLAFALSTDLAILAQLTLVTGASPSLTSLVAWAEFALFLALPFFFSGVVVESRVDAQPVLDRKGLRCGSDRRGHRVYWGACDSECDERNVGGVVGRCSRRTCRARFRQLRARRPSRNPLRPVASCFATAAASSQGACFLRLPTCSRSMAFDRRSSRINWKHRPISPMIAGIRFPASPSVKATKAHQRRGGSRRALHP